MLRYIINFKYEALKIQKKTCVGTRVACANFDLWKLQFIKNCLMLLLHINQSRSSWAGGQGCDEPVWEGCGLKMYVVNLK